MNNLTILYGPVTLRYRIKNLIRKRILKRSYYGGHVTLTESLISGLDRVGFDKYNFQPTREKNVAKHVHVLAGVDTLAYAIRLKKRGKIDRLTVGPNIDFDSTEMLMSDPSIDFCIKHSQWEIDEQIRRTPGLQNRIGIWASGVDLQHIQVPGENVRRKKVIIYQKYTSNILCHWVDWIVRSYGYETQIIKYGDYAKEDYLRDLDEAMFMVTLDAWETQGIFLTEAWAKDVPTFCFDMEYFWREEYQCEGKASSCPFLSDKTGIRWKNIDELKYILENFCEQKDIFSPRKWVEENMTIELAAKNFLELIGIDDNEKFKNFFDGWCRDF